MADPNLLKLVCMDQQNCNLQKLFTREKIASLQYCGVWSLFDNFILVSGNILWFLFVGGGSTFFILLFVVFSLWIFRKTLFPCVLLPLTYLLLFSFSRRPPSTAAQRQKMLERYPWYATQMCNVRLFVFPYLPHCTFTHAPPPPSLSLSLLSMLPLAHFAIL